MANISVYFAPALFSSDPYYHEFIVYTDDSGNQYFIRGGPSSREGYSLDTGSVTGGNGGPGPYGYILVSEGAYVIPSVDYASPGTYYSQTLMTAPQSVLGPIWSSMDLYAASINSDDYIYAAAGPNCNSVVTAVLQYAGLPTPQGNSLDGIHPAPGSNVPLTATSSASPYAQAVLDISSLFESELQKVITQEIQSLKVQFQKAIDGIIGGFSALSSYMIGDGQVDGINQGPGSNGSQVFSVLGSQVTGIEGAKFFFDSSDVLTEFLFTDSAGTLNNYSYDPTTESLSSSVTESSSGNSTWIIYSPASYVGTITAFQPGDTIDLSGIGDPTSAAFDANNVLTVKSNSGSTSLDFDPNQDFSNESFFIESDGSGGTEVVAVSDSAETYFSASGQTILILDPENFSGYIGDFQPGDTIDLVGVVVFDGMEGFSFKVEGGGSLNVNVGFVYTSTPFNLWPAQYAVPDGNGGTDIVFGSAPGIPPPVATVPADVAVNAGTITAITGIAVISSEIFGTNDMTVTLTDDGGLLSATPELGGAVTNDGLNKLILSGSEDDINAELATLKYFSAPGATSDTIDVEPEDQSGEGIDQQIAVTIEAQSSIEPPVIAPADPETVLVSASVVNPLTHVPSTYTAGVTLAATNTKIAGRVSDFRNVLGVPDVVATYVASAPDPAGSPVTISNGGTQQFYPTTSRSIQPGGSADIGFSAQDTAPGIYPHVTVPLTVGYEGSSKSVNLDVTGYIYAPAVAQVADPYSVSYLIDPDDPYVPQFTYDDRAFHVGDSATLSLVVSNIGTGSLTDTLRVDTSDIGFVTPVNPQSVGTFEPVPSDYSGLISGIEESDDIAAGQTGTLTIVLNTSLAGLFTITNSDLSFISHDPDLPDIAASSNSFDYELEISNYATPVFTGSGVTGSGTNWNLDFGVLQAGQSLSPSSFISIYSDLSDDHDGFEGYFSISGDGFTSSISTNQQYSGNDLVNGYAGTVAADTSVLGSHTETITFHPTDVAQPSYAIGAYYSTVLPDVTLTVTDDIVPDIPNATISGEDGGLTASIGVGLRWAPCIGQESGNAKRESRRLQSPCPCQGSHQAA